VPIFARHVTAASPTVLRDTVGGLSSRTYGGEPLESADLGQLKVSSGKKASYRRFTLPKVKTNMPSQLSFKILIYGSC
jgi:hypothetical protein